MMKIHKLMPVALLVGLIGVVVSCNKKNEYPVAILPELATFRNISNATYNVLNDTTSYKVPVGVTNVSNVDRTFTLNVVSNTGAVRGTHYRINKTTVTIPAGRVLDSSVIIQGVSALYQGGRTDTLKIFFTDPARQFSYNDTLKVLVRKPCIESDVVLSSFLGAYTRTNETFGTSAYGPYSTTVSAVTPLTATTGTIVVTNIWDNGWGPITFLLDWSNPNNRTAVPIAQAAIPGSNAGDLGATYAGRTIAVQPFAGQPGTFSVCAQTLTLRMQLGVTGLGYFGTLYTVNMAR